MSDSTKLSNENTMPDGKPNPKYVDVLDEDSHCWTKIYMYVFFVP